MMTMDRRFSRESSRESKGSIALLKKIVESQRPHTTKNVPDLTDFMNDMLFGTMEDDKKACNLTGCHSEDEEESFDDSTRSSSSELTQEWLDAARRMVASTPSRRDPLSRSARRYLMIWIYFMCYEMKEMQFIPDLSSPHQSNDRSSPLLDPPALNLPPRQSSYGKSRFQTETPATTPQGIPVTSRRTFKPAPILRHDTQLLSPPKNLNESAQRRSISSNTCSKPETPLLSPPKNLMESAHRRSISKSTCSIEKVDLESLMMEGKLSILVVGQDAEVGSQCTILTDNYCEDAYDLLQTPVLKKLLQHRQKQILMPLAERTSSSWQSGLVLVNKDHKNVSL
ncbi:hypothetical protein DKX38_022791 [Salix brachista]|uniref:Uncharacterized protein n=1 Tax=Salix brachista TaxID=2182728 RepID=A0A5N5K127_9ROSI|nr:hypothetical protein DKX38_022791 [Salix brachista]